MKAEPWDDFEDEPDDYEEDFVFDCGWTPDVGGCQLAGSEDCDFECPNRGAMIADLKRRSKGKMR